MRSSSAARSGDYSNLLAHKHSFTITRSNNKTEKQGVDFLRKRDPRFVLLDKEGRKVVMESLAIPKQFSRTFDMIYVHQRIASAGSITIRDPASIDVIEVKTTQKKLPDFPAGFFFGATENEFTLAEKLGDRFKFCLLSLHPESRKFMLLTLNELNQRIRTKRVQFQINL